MKTSQQTCDPKMLIDEPTVETAVCALHGEYPQKVFMPVPGMAAIRSRCPQCAARAAEVAEEQGKRQRAAERLMRVQALTGDSGVPQRFRSRSFENYDPEVKPAKMALAVCKRFANDFANVGGQSIVLTGGPGTGKTHLACAIANQVIEHNLAAVRFVTVSEMLRRIKETYHRDSVATESEVIAAFVRCDLLIIDEIGVQVGSDHEKMLLFEVLNARYSDLRPTILISNLSAGDLEEFLGHRVMDRYRECGVVLPFDWESYRGRRAA